MDAINHMTQGFLISYIPTGSIPIGITGAIVAAVPDIGGEIAAHIFKDGYKFYDSAHFGKINRYARILPPWFLHTIQDKYLHKVGSRWWVLKEAGWYEILTWIINLLTIVLIWKTL